MKVNDRIAALRTFFTGKGVKAYITPSTDPHQSEYVAPHWEARKWVSGFTGSAGTVVVTESQAGLWTDSRYFLQAGQQLEGTEMTLYKERLPETPTIAQFLCDSLQPGDAVGIDGEVFSTTAARALAQQLAGHGIELTCIDDPYATIWPDRPALPVNPAFVLESCYAGRSIAEKLADIRLKMKQQGAESVLVSALDEIAWTLNLRGSDVHCNPVFIAYLLITCNDAYLYIMPGKLSADTQAVLQSQQISVMPYDTVGTHASKVAGGSVLLNPAQTNYSIYLRFAAQGKTLIEAASPVTLLKAVRNATEAINIRLAMERDGVAMVRFLMWLEQAVPTGTATEVGVDRELHRLRAAQPLFMGESFDTIAGYGPHGAIVHYEATPETDVKLLPCGLLLVDSGAQYLDGTTDITRTIALGPLTQEEKDDYTLILKGHINLGMAVFPQGTRGAQLDALARMPIWKRHMNFLHGTGHGVGSFLNVHEGPQSIRMEENPVVLQAGMAITNEPGVYKTGKHGVRIENMLLVVPAGEGMFGDYLQFETLTLCPIDKRPIVRELLNQEEIEWLNNYHRMVYQRLSPLLDETERQWLRQATTAL